MILDHLQSLTHDWGGVHGVAVYSQRDREGNYRPLEAKGEGWACLDDTARAALLAFELSEDLERGGYHSAENVVKSSNLMVEAGEQALKWMTFVEHMLDNSSGKFANFIDRNGVINERGDTSYRGGEWWQARGLWALARAYRCTKSDKWLNLYWIALRGTRPRDARTLAMVNLAKIETSQTGVLQPAIPVLYNYYRLGETFGYHQIYSGVMASRHQGLPLTLVNQAVREYVEPMVRDMFWTNWQTKEKAGLCPYNVSSVVQGLAELYRLSETDQNLRLLEDAYNWFYGRNDRSRVMYDVETGRCFDGLDNENCGAESSIEAGLAELAVHRAIGSNVVEQSLASP